MKKVATVTPKDFRLAYGKISSVRTSNALLPILENVHVKAFAKGFILTCTDLNTTGITGMKATPDDATATFLLPQAAISILEDLPADMQIEIWTDGKDQLQFCGMNLKVNFTYENPADYPVPPTFEPKVTIKDDKFEETKKFLTEAKAFASKDDLKPFLTGVFFSGEAIVATDAHRMIVINYNPKPSRFPEFAGVIVPKKCITCIDKLDDKVENQIAIGDGFISFTDKKTKIISSLTAGAFPDYKTILPKEDKTSYILNRKELQGFIKLALSVTNKATNQVNLHFYPEDKVYNLTGGDTDYGTSINLHGIAQPSQGDHVKEVSFNGQYLNSALSLLSQDELRLQINNGGRTCIREDKYNFLLMALAV